MGRKIAKYTPPTRSKQLDYISTFFYALDMISKASQALILLLGLIFTSCGSDNKTTTQDKPAGGTVIFSGTGTSNLPTGTTFTAKSVVVSEDKTRFPYEYHLLFTGNESTSTYTIQIDYYVESFPGENGSEWVKILLTNHTTNDVLSWSISSFQVPIQGISRSQSDITFENVTTNGAITLNGTLTF